MAKKFKVSPKGVAVWPKVNRPDTKFDADGVYSIDLKLEGKTAKEFAKFIDAHVADSFAEAKKENKKAAKQITAAQPFKPEVDDEGDETGATLFRFKRKAIGKNGKTGETWKNIVKLFDTKGQRCNVLLGGGSDVKVSFSIRPYYMASTKSAGVTLDLRAVQIINLVQGGTSESYGFGEEDGWEDDGTAVVDTGYDTKDEDAPDTKDEDVSDDDDGEADGEIDF